MAGFDKKVYIRMIRQAIGDEKMTHFAARAGISAGNFSRIRKGQIATPEVLRKIANASDTVTYPELMDAAGYSSNLLFDLGSESVGRRTVCVPVVYQLDRPKEELLTDDATEFEIYYADTLPKGKFFNYVATDDAIVPEGSRVMIDITKTPKDDDAVLFLLDGEIPLLRRVTKINRSYFYYGNDKNKYPMTPLKKSQMTVYGVAVEAKVFF